ncbi:hypothetical protein HN832_00655 [archaeon]|jgi:hypothetical protein|nr:hypothetical protein [archaeon]MBT4373868.1 hypothetical protein [archaeon]MBT4532390.1 hypothetical protein [archaeon]MBT7001771.1 hypothetical protein [archaeon]MBT7281904.1 hypothetical protein [archaeon]
MFKTKELALIIVISLILAFSITLVETQQIFLWTLLSVFLVIMVNLIAKKITAYNLDSEIEAKLWQLERWGLSGIILTGGIKNPNKKFRTPIPVGAIFPIVSKLIFLSLSNLVWMASLVFDVKTKVYKAAKRHNPIYSFSEITDYQIGLIAASGIIANLVFAVIGYLIGLPPQMNFAQLSIFYAFWNVLPLSNLDGNRIYWGNNLMWYTIAAITLMAFGYALFVI